MSKQVKRETLKESTNIVSLYQGNLLLPISPANSLTVRIGSGN
jgi:hypothetical protein